MKHTFDTWVGDYPALNLDITQDDRLYAVRECVRSWLLNCVLPPTGAINNSCKQARHGVAYVSVNETNEASNSRR